MTLYDVVFFRLMYLFLITAMAANPPANAAHQEDDPMGALFGRFDANHSAIVLEILGIAAVILVLVYTLSTRNS